MEAKNGDGVGRFDCAESSGLAERWKRWIRAFELYVTSKGITQAERKRAMLLHSAGMDVQDIFFTLEEIPVEGAETVYEQAKKMLNRYFTPQANVPYERLIFRNMCQEESENIEQFITRLRQKAVTCKFENVEEEIRDQVINKCLSQTLRRKLLQKGGDLTLADTKEIARALEESERQASSIEGQDSQVNRVTTPRGNREFDRRKSWKPMCYACGYSGHIAKDPSCPAKDQKCRKCGMVGHFEKKCKTKIERGRGSRSESRGRGRDQAQSRGRGFRHDSSKKVYNVESDTEQNKRLRNDDMYENVYDDDDDFVFHLCDNEDGFVNVSTGGVKMRMMIDTGASCNVIDRNEWDRLRNQGIKVRCQRKVDKYLNPYGAGERIKVFLVFRAQLNYGSKSFEEEFNVIEQKGTPLLSRKTSIRLGVVSFHVNAVNEESVLSRYPEVFEGLGKLKDFQLKIPVDETVPPTIQKLRRVPYQLRDKVAGKLDELEKLDIIEKVQSPSDWISPLVVVAKDNGDVRLCVDMRRANEAVRRVQHPIPTVEEVLQDLNDSTVFSKLDIKWAYHQIELDPESREITTFITDKGLYRYKRLMFGISCAPEMYQNVLQQILQECEGVHNIMDDIVVHGSSREEHDARLEKVVKILKEKGLTLNGDKCKMNMPKIKFMGHVLSARGVGPSDVKVKAVLDAREPGNAKEVRSFLGLVNYSARFIPDLATKSAPLRELTKKDAKFVWGDEQQKSFDVLKESLGKAEILGYYKKDARTQVITDAGPEGLGAVLVQEQNEEFRVISYASRSLSDVEKKYSQTEKEALGIVWACERFHLYLYGCDFELLTDHKPLEFIYSSRSKPCARIERWILRLQPYRYKVVHIAGTSNIADALSRLLDKNECERECDLDSDEYVYNVAVNSTPVAMTTREIERESADDDELRSVRESLITGKWDKSSEYFLIRHELCAIGKLVLRGTKIVIPVRMRNRVLSLAHEGHPGMVVMKQRLRSKVWWPGIAKHVENYCKRCHGCQVVSAPSKPEPMQRTELPTAPWEYLAADLLGPLPSGEYIFVLVDYYSRYIEIEVMKSTSSEKITESLMRMFSTHGLPVTLRTDNGPQFVSAHFKEFMEENGIKHQRNTPLWPQANGEVECQNKFLMKRIRIAHAEGQNWKLELQKYLLMYRSTPHSTTGISPAELLFGRKIRTKLPELQDYKLDDEEIRDRDAKQKEKGKSYGDEKRHAVQSDIKPGDKVLLKQNKENKLTTPFSYNPYVVQSKNGNSVVVESGGVEYKRNVTHVKKYLENEVQNEGEEKTDCEIIGTNDKESMCEEIIQRPIRNRQKPVRFNDYVVD